MSLGAIILRIKLFGRTVESFVRKYRAYLSPKAYRLNRRIQAVSLDKGGLAPVSVISLRSSDILIDSGRYFNGLVSGLLSVGHCVCVVKKIWVVKELSSKQYSRDLITSGRVEFVTQAEVDRHDGQGCYLWSDWGASWSGAKQIRISRSNFKQNRGLWIPYQAHPANCPLPTECSIDETGEQRAIKVFFSGRVTPSYDSDFVRSHGVMTRNRIIETLYASDLPHVVYDELKETSPEFNSQLLLPRYNAETKRSSGAVPNELYLSNFKKVSFVICAPGTFMPFAHNVVEALSQGCIPILEYGAYFTPELVAGENCLAFNDDESLVAAVKQALEMQHDEVVKMREQVVRYYQTHLRFSSFIDRIDKAGRHVEAFYIA